MRDVSEEVSARNDPAFGETGDRLRAAVAALETATAWLLDAQADGRAADALAGATPYQRLFGLVLTGAYLAKGGLVAVDNGQGDRRASLCRFMAENLLAETSALKDRVIAGSASLTAARAVLD